MKNWTFHCPHPRLGTSRWTCAMILSLLPCISQKKKMDGKKKKGERKKKERKTSNENELMVMYKHMDTHLTMPHTLPPPLFPWRVVSHYPLPPYQFCVTQNVNHLYNINLLWMMWKKREITAVSLLSLCYGRQKRDLYYLYICFYYYYDFVWCCFAMQAKIKNFEVCVSLSMVILHCVLMKCGVTMVTFLFLFS